MFDDDYCVVTRPRQDDQDHDLLPILGPDEDTAELEYRGEVLPLGHKPLIFVNAMKDFRHRNGKTTLKTPPPVLFDGDNPIVRSKVRDELLALDIPDLALQPAIFMDDWGNRHDDYWFLAFLETRRYWDASKSRLGGSILMGDDALQTVHDFALDDARLRRVALKDRLLFQMDSLPSIVVAHRSVASLFQGDGNSGALVIPIRDYPNRP
jgi:hypothetical protein